MSLTDTTHVASSLKATDTEDVWHLPLAQCPEYLSFCQVCLAAVMSHMNNVTTLTCSLQSCHQQAHKVCHHCLHCQVVGASGIVFGLMGLYAGDVLLNFRSLTLPWLRLLWVTASCIYFVVSSILQVRQPVWLGWCRLAVGLLWCTPGVCEAHPSMLV